MILSFIRSISLLGTLLAGHFTTHLSAQTIYSPTQLQEDFEIFKGTLKDFHPGLDWYLSDERLERLFDSTISTFTEPLEELEFYNRLATITSGIRCGHLRSWPSESTTQQIWSKGKFLPLDLKFSGERAWCVGNQTSDSSRIRPGDEVLEINGLSTSELVRLAYRKLPGDGYNRSRKMAFLERYFYDFYAFHVGWSESYSVIYRDSTGTERSTVLEGLSIGQIHARRQENQQSAPVGNLQLAWTGKEDATLTIRAFSNWEEQGNRVNFNKELHRLFLKIDSARIKHLILDLRDNGGGNDRFGLELFSYFHDAPVIEFAAMEHQLSPSEFAEYTDLKNFHIRLIRLFTRSKKQKKGRWSFRGFKALKPFRPSQPQFRGAVYILINGRSFSTTADFCALMKSHDLATFIGEETGGGYYGNSSWLSVNLVLPHTQIRVQIPTVRYTTNVVAEMPEGRGVLPDYPVEPSPEDILRGIDPQMNFTLQTIRKNE